MVNSSYSRSDIRALLGSSEPMQALYETIDMVASSKATILLSGENGTGKEACAQLIHQKSQRTGPFIVLNCAAIPKNWEESVLFGHTKGAFIGALTNKDGAVKTADGGTLFLDEIDKMDIGLQSCLLRFLQTETFQKVGSHKQEQVDVRLIVATDRDILSEVNAGRFRENLYYQISVVHLELPTLRQREKDILRLARVFIKKYAQLEQKSFQGLSRAVDKIFLDYDWPGNIWQLECIIHHVVLLNDAKTVTVEMLPAVLSKKAENPSEDEKRENPSPSARSKHALPNTGAKPLHDDTIRPLWLLEKEAIVHALELSNGNISKAARELEISAQTIYRKLHLWEKTE
jgi:two-component system repressor protein LuxO